MKNKSKGKELKLPYISNMNNTNNFINNYNNRWLNVTKSIIQINNKNYNKKNKYNKINNNNSKINNYFHKLKGKIENNSLSNKSSGISYSSSTKDNSKNQSFKYQRKIRRSFQIIKHV